MACYHFRKSSPTAPISLVVVFLLLLGLTHCDKIDKEFCMDRTGLGYGDVESFKFRNENCTVDCIMRQGIVQSYHIADGTPCFNNKDNYRCILGVCRDPDGQRLATFNDLYSTEISIISAFVPDMDDLPGAGGSDVFVTIEVANDGFPNYKAGDIVCYTYVIQDNNRPRWNFKCKPLPMTGETKLRFRALDSDKPFSLNPDKLGVAVEDVSTLMEKGRTKMRLTSSDGVKTPYYVEVELKGSRYEQPKNDIIS